MSEEKSLFKMEQYSNTIYAYFDEFVKTVFDEGECFFYDSEDEREWKFSNLVNAWKTCKKDENFEKIIKKGGEALIAEKGSKWKLIIDKLKEPDEKKMNLLFAHVHYLWSLGGDIDTSVGDFIEENNLKFVGGGDKKNGCHLKILGVFGGWDRQHPISRMTFFLY